MDPENRLFFMKHLQHIIELMEVTIHHNIHSKTLCDVIIILIILPLDCCDCIIGRLVYTPYL